MDIFSPTIIDNAIITGSNNASLLQVSSPSATSAFFISGSGMVGIGTTSPLSTLSVAGGNININSGYSIGGNALGSYVPFLRYNNTGAGVPSSSFGHTTAYITSLGGGVFGTNDLIFYAGGLTQTEIVRIVGSTGFVGIGESSPSAKLEIKGSGATSATTALRVENSSAAARLTILDDGTSAFNTSHLYVSSSGNVGIGTTTPQRELDVNGAIRVNTIHRGGGSSTLNILTDNSSAARINIGGALIGTLYDTNPNTNEIRTTNNQNLSINARGSGSLFLQTTDTTRLTITGSNVGIGTTTPTNTLQVVGGITATSITASIISASSGITGSLFGTSSWAVSASQALTASFLNGAFLQNGNSFGATAVLGTNDNQDLQFETNGSVRMTISSSGNIGIGTNLPSAELHISGASVDSLLRVGSPTNPDILFVNGNGRVGINTTSSTSFLGGSNISTFTIFQNSGSGDGLTPSTGLQIINSGSSTSAQAQLSIVTVGDKFASFNIGTSGSGTQNNFWHLSKRNAANGHALNLYNNNNGTFSGPLFSFVSAGTSTLGEYTQIQINDITGRVGLQTTPSDFIHLYSEPGTNYLRIDATSVQAPPVNLASAKSGFGIIANDYFLAEPDYWMEIKLDANVVLIPCYLPA